MLDLGIGMGFYGAAIRQWLDFGISIRRTYLAGVEGFPEYRNPCWDLYDAVFEMTIEEFLAWDTYVWDAILIMDVIEHFEKQQGIQVIKQAKERIAKDGKLYVGTPAVFIEQGAEYGNELETHRSLWSKDDFVSLGFDLLVDGTLNEWGHQMLLGVLST